MPLRYKFVELSIVAEDTLEEVVNRWVGEGWTFDGVRFVVGEASRRPTMAFVSFVREDAAVPADRRDPDVEAPVLRPRRRAPPAPAPIELGEFDLPED